MQIYSKTRKYVNIFIFNTPQDSSPVGAVLRRTRPNATCIPNRIDHQVHT